jgi:hypothetical protein
MTEWGQDENQTRQVFVSRTKRVYYLLLSIIFLSVASAFVWYGLPYFLKKTQGSWREVVEEKYLSAYEKKYSFEIVLPPEFESSDVSVQVRRIDLGATGHRYTNLVIQEKEADEVFTVGKLGPPIAKNESTNKRVYVELLNTRLLGMDEKAVDPTRIFVRLVAAGISTGDVAKQFFRGEQRGFQIPNHQEWQGNELRFMSLDSQDVGGKYRYDFVVVISPPYAMLD